MQKEIHGISYRIKNTKRTRNISITIQSDGNIVVAKHPRISAGYIEKLMNETNTFFDKKNIPKKLKIFFEKYAVDTGDGRYFLCGDNTRFMNHSKNPNIKSLGKGSKIAKDGVAIKNIKPGDEITIDYESLEDVPIDFKVVEK